MTDIRDLTHRLAQAQPELTKALLWAFSRAYLALPGKRSVVPLRGVMSAVGYRVPVSAKLANGMDVIVPWNDDGGNALYRSGYYEPATVKLFERLLTPAMVVFDVGANIGQYTLVACDRIGKAGEVHAWEPDPVTFEWLSRNVHINGLGNVRLNQSAVFNNTEPVSLRLASTRDTGSNSMVGDPWIKSGKSVTVPCTTLDIYMAEHPITRVDVMKVDVEGAELGVLRGADKLLHDHQPVLLLEFEERMQRQAGTSCRELADHLAKKGYALFRIGDSHEKAPEPYVIGPNEPPSLNVLAVPESRRAAVFARMGW